MTSTDARASRPPRSAARLIFVALLALPPVPASAVQESRRADAESALTMARALESQGKIAESVHFLRDAAELGSTQAMVRLGRRLETGDGVERDPGAAVSWYGRAAKRKDPEALTRLGDLWSSGEGVKRRDMKRAIAHYRAAAKLGYSPAQNNLGLLYHLGESVERDPETAATWFRRAAEQGNPWAQNNLGDCYFNGWGVERDFEEAARLYRSAAEGGHQRALLAVGFTYEHGRGVNRDLAEAELWYRRAASLGDPRGQLLLARVLILRAGRADPSPEARQLIESAAAADNVEALVALGDLYRQGLGVPRDLARAEDLYRRAAAAGHSGAAAALSALHGEAGAQRRGPPSPPGSPK